MNAPDSPLAHRDDNAFRSIDQPRNGRVVDACALLARLTRLAIIGEYDVRQRLQQLLSDALRMVNADRAAVWRMTNGGESLVLETRASRLNAGEHAPLPLDSRTSPRYFRALHSGEVLVASLDQIDPPLSELWSDYSLTNGISAKLDIPLIAIGRTVGLISFERSGAHPAWSNDDVTLALSIANLVQLGDWDERAGVAAFGAPGEHLEHSLPRLRTFRPL